MISVSHVSKTFRSGGTVTAALQDVSLEVAEGAIFGVIGQSGAGKSTLIRAVNLLECPDSGTVTVDGEDLTALSPGHLRLEIVGVEGARPRRSRSPSRPTTRS